MLCFSIASIILLVDGFNYYGEISNMENNDFCKCENEELLPYICSVRFVPFSSFAISNYFYFFGVVGLMLYKDIPSFTDVYLLLKNKYLTKKD